MTKLSVNINKVACIRNARGGNVPDVLECARRCQEYGADGITVHPRPDQRHIRYDDVRSIKPLITTEFNIEGNPIAQFMDLVLEVVPTQVTLVPDAPDAITSNAGWDTVAHKAFLSETCATLKKAGIRASIFVNPDPAMVNGAAECGADRVELYTEGYAARYRENPRQAIAGYYRAACEARKCGLGLNAGHDLDLTNLHYFIQTIPWTDEVSIGHALVSDALYMGFEKTIAAYLDEIHKF